MILTSEHKKACFYSIENYYLFNQFSGDFPSVSEVLLL